MMERGDKVRAKQRLYLARWVEAGEKGEIVGEKEPGKWIVRLEDGHEYVLSPSEIEPDD